MDHADQRSFGDLLVRYRLRVGEARGTSLSAETLANEIYVSPNTLRKYESSEGGLVRGPKKDLVEKLATFFAAELGLDARERAAFVAAAARAPTRDSEPTAGSAPPLPAPVPRDAAAVATGEDQVPAGTPGPTAGARGPRAPRPGARSRMPGVGVVAALVAALAVATGHPALFRADTHPQASRAESDASQPLPTPSWPGYTVVRAIATCGAPRCVGFQAAIVLTFQRDAAARQVYLAGMPRCLILPATIPAQVSPCRLHKIDGAHKYAAMTYTAEGTDPRTRAARRARGWLRLDFFADGHTTRLGGDGDRIGGTPGI